MSHLLKMTQDKTTERAVRGKYAEDKVRDELKALSARRADFDFERNYDARSSMGRIPRRAGDFTFYMRGSHGVIEVKQVKHDYRLPRKNFDPEKFGILRKRQMAGGVVIVLVYHTPTRLWRPALFDYYEARRNQSSWDLTELDTFAKPAEALAIFGLR